MEIKTYTRKQNLSEKPYGGNLKVLFSTFKYLRVFPSLKSLQIIFFLIKKNHNDYQKWAFFYFGFESIILRNSQRIYKAVPVEFSQKKRQRIKRFYKPPPPPKRNVVGNILKNGL